MSHPGSKISTTALIKTLPTALELPQQWTRDRLGRVTLSARDRDVYLGYDLYVGGHVFSPEAPVSSPAISGALEILEALNPRTFTSSTGTHYGLVAAEVHSTTPIVAPFPDTGHVAYPELVSVLVAGIQEQQRQIDALAARCSQLESDVAVLQLSAVSQNTAISGLDSRTTALEVSQASQNDTISGLDLRTTALEVSQASQNTAISGLDLRTTALEMSQASQNTAISALEVSAVSQNTAISGLDSRTLVLESATASLQTGMQALEVESVAQGQEIDSLDARVTALELSAA